MELALARLEMIYGKMPGKGTRANNRFCLWMRTTYK